MSTAAMQTPAETASVKAQMTSHIMIVPLLHDVLTILRMMVKFWHDDRTRGSDTKSCDSVSSYPRLIRRHKALTLAIHRAFQPQATPRSMRRLPRIDEQFSNSCAARPDARALPVTRERNSKSLCGGNRTGAGIENKPQRAPRTRSDCRQSCAALAAACAAAARMASPRSVALASSS